VKCLDAHLENGGSKHVQKVGVFLPDVSAQQAEDNHFVPKAMRKAHQKVEDLW
jgi:hypothetical protein